MEIVRKNWKGFVLCFIIALPSWFVGRTFPLLGGPVTAIIVGMIIALKFKNRKEFETGIKFVSKKILQWAVILLGFGLNLKVIWKTGLNSLPIIVSTILISLIVAYLLQKQMNIPVKIATLVGVGSSICGGSAVAAAAPVIDADDGEIAQAISVIFFFNVLAAIIFPHLGVLLGFDTTTGGAFGIFAGTAINDTSSVTAAAATWDSMFSLSSQTLDKAVTVKLTRTLAIIPITFILSLLYSRIRNKSLDSSQKKSYSIKKTFPTFILLFILASIITTVLTSYGVSYETFKPFKQFSKFLIVMAMAAIGLNSNIVELIKKGGKPIFLGLSCWISITAVSLLMQSLMGIW